jgi:hypothetical protein
MVPYLLLHSLIRVKNTAFLEGRMAVYQLDNPCQDIFMIFLDTPQTHAHKPCIH